MDVEIKEKLDGEVYARQKLLTLNDAPASIVVGLGGTGSWVALFLAMSGCPHLHLMDSDRLEVSNFNRLPYPMDENLGKLKVEAAQDFIRKLRSDCEVTTDGKADELTLSLAEGDVLFDCTDNGGVQLMLGKWARANNKQYIRVGYDGTHMTVTEHMSAWQVGTARTGYNFTPSWACPASIAAAFGVAKLMYDPTIEIHHDLKEIGKEQKK